MKDMLRVATVGLAGAGFIVGVTSFFVKDNTKAVNRRWIALGLFVASYGVELTNKFALGATAKK